MIQASSFKIIFFGGFKGFSEIYLNTLRSAGFEVVSEAKKADLGVIAYYGKIIPKNVLGLPNKGFLNVHPSLLPRWRGPSPVQAAILAGDKTTGVTIHLATEKPDAGPVLAQKEIPIESKDTCLSLTGKLANEGAFLLIPTIEKWLSGEITPRKQDHSKATFTKLFKKEDGRIDWSKSAEFIERQVRAYYPWPGAHTKVKDKILKIKNAEVIEGPSNFKPGRFFEDGGYPAVASGEKALKLLTVQPEGKKEMPGDAYLRGHREFLK